MVPALLMPAGGERGESFHTKIRGKYESPTYKDSSTRADAAFVSPSYTRVYPLVVEDAQGLWVRDVDGNRFLDFTAGIAVNSTGH
jgi:4-aminobutyrate aminotransferase